MNRLKASSVWLLAALGLFACRTDDDPTADPAVPADAGVSDDLQRAGPLPEQLSGTYLLAVSIKNLSPRTPSVFLVEIEAERDGQRTVLRMRQQPLSKLDRTTPAGLWSSWNTGYFDADGVFESAAVHAYIPAEANPIVSYDTEAEIALHGHLADAHLSTDGDEPRYDFLCGDVTGQILSPLEIPDISGSTFTASRIDHVDDPASYPAVVIDCARTPARSLTP